MKLSTILLTAACVSFASAAFAQNDGSKHPGNMFGQKRLDLTFSSGAQPASDDAILPNGDINLAPYITGSVKSSFYSQPRLQCATDPNTDNMTTNTFDGSVASSCP